MGKRFRASIRIKLISISFLLLIAPLLIVSFSNYFQSKSNLDELGKINLKNGVVMTLEMIDALNKEVESGKISLEEAQEKVKVAILGEKDNKGIRPINNQLNLGENGYIFIVDPQGNVMAHISLEGQNMWEAQNAAGEKFVQKQ